MAGEWSYSFCLIFFPFIFHLFLIPTSFLSRFYFSHFFIYQSLSLIPIIVCLSPKHLSPHFYLSIAVTRAKCGLIVIGDSRTLKNERHWRAFVDWCRSEGCYVSSPLSPDVLGTLYASSRLPPPAIPSISSGNRMRDMYNMRNTGNVGDGSENSEDRDITDDRDDRDDSRDGVSSSGSGNSNVNKPIDDDMKRYIRVRKRIKDIL